MAAEALDNERTLYGWLTPRTSPACGVCMKLAAWVVAILLLVAGIALFIEALTTTNSGWLSIPLLALSGVFTCPGIIALLALFGLYDLDIEVNGHWVEFRKRSID
jgi:hypothetical protein